MASNAISTAGMLVKYATGATRPTSGYTTIPGVKAIPAIFNDPNMLDSTPLSALRGILAWLLMRLSLTAN